MTFRTLARLLLAAAPAALLALPVPAPAADRGKPERHRIETSQASASILLPDRWQKARTSTASTLRTVSVHGRECRYAISFTVRRFAAPSAPAAEVAEERVPGARAYVLDRGARAGAAWRVVRRPGQAGPTEVRGALVVPAGQGQWREVAATARSRANDECHLGTYRDVVGPLIGRTLASARVGA
jgi:hypothetical protein